MMFIDNKFNFGQIVYLITDPEQKKRIVTNMQIDPTGIMYRLMFETSGSWHHDIEISPEKNVVTTFTS